MKRQAITTQFFYQNGKLVTVNQGGQKRAIFRSADMPLAELSIGERQETGLLEVEQNGSVLKVSGDADDEERHAYSAYGHDPSLPSQRTMAGFNGEHIEAVAAGYLLGNGYRLFNPALMRFHSADSLSPFGIGGLNAYIYCSGDPVNKIDPSGHAWFSRAPNYKINHYTKKISKLKNIQQQNLDKIEHYNNKIAKYTHERNMYRLEARSNNYSDQNGNTPRQLYLEAEDSIKRNVGKRNTWREKETALNERILRNEGKLTSARAESDRLENNIIAPTPNTPPASRNAPPPKYEDAIAEALPPSYESLTSVTSLNDRVRRS